MSPNHQQETALKFASLHAARPGFIMPNAWDAGSAIVLSEAGFKAIATTSAGIAFSLGKPDFDVRDAGLAVTREEMFERIRQIADAVDLPVNGDLEAGYGDGPEAVAETVRLAITAGLAGGNIEDKKPHEEGLYDEALAVDRIKAARATIESSAIAFVLTARTDALQISSDGLKSAIRRANLYREAGADCLFTPGVADLGDIKTLVREIDGPLNVVMGLGNSGGNAHALIEAGVQRISLGGSIARSTLGFVRACAAELRTEGSVSFAAGQVPQRDLNSLFARARTARGVLRAAQKPARSR